MPHTVTPAFIVMLFGTCALAASTNFMRANCNSKCICEENGTDVIVTCTKQDFHSLPLHIPEDVTVLRVGGNKIRDIPNYSMQRFSRLRELDLSAMLGADGPFILQSNSFYGLESLRVLNMEKVAYSLDAGCNSSRPFRHIKTLRELNLRNVNAQNLSCLNSAFDDLRQLTRLSFRIDNHPIPQSLASMKDLKVLDLGGSQFKSMDQRTFNILRNISVKVLSLRGVQFDSVHSLALLPTAHSLQALDYSCPRTKNTNPNLFAPILPSFQNSTALRVLNLDGVYKNNDGCLKLQASQFSPLQRVHLVSLSIRENAITTLRDFYLDIRFVKYLNLNYNPLHLKYAPDKHYWYKVILSAKKLKTISVSYTAQSKLSTCLSDVNWVFWEQIEKAEQQKDDEDLEQAKDWLNRTTLTITVRLENLTVSHVNIADFDMPSAPINLSEIRCPSFIDSSAKCSVDLSSLSRIDLSYVNVPRLDWPVYGMNNVKYANFEHDNLEFVHPETFRALPSLQTLRLAGNRFGLFTTEDDLISIFSNLTNIRKIDLADNMLTTVPNGIFSNCIALVSLNLERNPLITFGLDFSFFPSLRYVDLNNCKIQEFKGFQVDFFKASSSLKMNVSGLGDFDCQNCNNKDFYEMIRLNKSLVQLEGQAELTCTNDGVREKLVDIDLTRIEFSCIYIVFVIASVTAAAVVSISVVTILYCRWNIKYLVYSVKMKLRNRDNLHANFFEYGVYLSFNDDDQDIALKLFTGLTNKGIDVFYWPRNSRPGTCTFEEIFEQLDRSKKILVLITPNSEDSVTQNFEIRMSLPRGKGFIIPVVTDDFVVGNNLPGPIKNLLRHDLYFPWPEQEEDQNQFWRHLQRAVLTKGGVQFRRNGCVAYYGE